jgi:hypothetical protein
MSGSHVAPDGVGAPFLAKPYDVDRLLTLVREEIAQRPP